MSDGLIGKKLGQYEVRMLLGKGGMSTVYLAYQPSMDRTVAIKVLPREFLHDDTFLFRFKQEIRTIAGLEHLHILPVYDVGEDAGLPYFVMRYLTGGTLADMVSARMQPLSAVIRILTQVSGAIDYAHERGIIHRDIKPSNVLLDNGGNAYLADFGIARVREAASVTTESRIIGTPPYIAPEMVRSGEEITPSIDIYALGAIGYEMLVGEPPYFDVDPMKTLMAHVLEPVPSVRDFDPNISQAVDNVIKRCMAKTPDKRYATAGAFVADLTRAAEGAHQTLQSPPVGSRPLSERLFAGDPADPVVEFVIGDEPEDEPGPGLLRRRWVFPLAIVGVLLVSMVVTAIVFSGGRISWILGTDDGGEPLPTATDLPGLPTVTNTLPADVPTVTAEPMLLPPPEGGDRLAFSSDRDGDFEIFIIDINGQNLRQLTFNVTSDFGAAWSPDGQSIVYATMADGDAEIATMMADGSGIDILTDNDIADADPAWSPDGEWIAFASNRDGDFDIYIMRTDGSDVRQLTRDEVDNYWPTWSPDGAQIAFYTRVNNNTDTTEIYIVNVDDLDIIRLTTNTVFDQWPDWSPDGQSMVFTSGQDMPPGRRAVRLLNLNTMQSRLVTDGAVHDDDPALSPDGQKIAYDSDRDGDGIFDLYVLDLASGGVVQLTFDNADDIAPAWQPQRP